MLHSGEDQTSQQGEHYETYDTSDYTGGANHAGHLRNPCPGRRPRTTSGLATKGSCGGAGYAVHVRITDPLAVVNGWLP
jgi:hypothetical protein